MADQPRFDGKDFLSWLIALVIVGAAAAGAFFALPVLRADPQRIEAQAADSPARAGRAPRALPRRARGSPPQRRAVSP